MIFSPTTSTAHSGPTKKPTNARSRREIQDAFLRESSFLCPRKRTPSFTSGLPRNASRTLKQASAAALKAAPLYRFRSMTSSADVFEGDSSSRADGLERILSPSLVLRPSTLYTSHVPQPPLSITSAPMTPSNRPRIGWPLIRIPVAPIATPITNRNIRSAFPRLRVTLRF